MDVGTILQLTKDRLGFKSTGKDIYLIARIEGIISELEDEKGLVLDSNSSNHLMFVVDYVSWAYENKGKQEGMPRHIQYRLNNLMIKSGGATIV